MKTIPLTKGLFSIVDAEDYDKVSKYKWYVNHEKRGIFYAIRYVYPAGRKGRHIVISMHREILNLVEGDGKIVDHINRNGLDNRKENIRIVNNSLNALNCKIHSNNKSGYRGVHWHKRKKKWQAKIKIGKKQIDCGFYVDIFEAAKKYDEIAIKYRGDNAKLNFPRQTL